MIIEYLGHASFLITTNQNVKILTDPYQGVGYEMRSGLEADIITVSHTHFDHNYTAKIGGSPLILEKVGEQSALGIPFQGIKTFHDDQKGALRGNNVVFAWQVDEIKCCHLGDLGEACRLDILEKLGEVDLLFIPIGGKYTIDAMQAKEYVEKLQPKVVIPMHYKPKDGALDIATPDRFLSLFENIIFAKSNEEFSFLKNGEKMNVVFMERGEKRWITM